MKRVSVLCVALLLCLALSPGTAKDKSEIYTNAKWGFTLTVPAGWTLAAPPANTPPSVLCYMVRDNFIGPDKPFIQVSAQRVDTNDPKFKVIRSLEAYVADAMASIGKRKDAQILSITNLTPSGIEGKLVQFSYTVPEGAKVRGMIGVFFKNQVGYDVIGSTTPEAFDKVEKELRDIVNSFHMTEKK